MCDRMEQRKESTEIRICYGTEIEASSAYRWVEGMITCFYLYNEKYSFDSDEASHGDPFQLFILNYNEYIRDYDKNIFLERYPDCTKGIILCGSNGGQSVLMNTGFQLSRILVRDSNWYKENRTLLFFIQKINRVSDDASSP